MTHASTLSPERFALLSQVIRDVARARRLSPDDAQDFAQSVHVRLLERNYDVFDRFSGRSSLRTYLTVVMNRMLLDWQRSMLGKWRPSATARRLGPQAMLLDRLMHRDRHPRDEAVRIVVARAADATTPDIDRLATLLPARPARQRVTIEAAEAHMLDDFADPVDARERSEVAARIGQALRAALRQLPAEDRRLLALRYGAQQQIAGIARALQVDQKGLYRRCNRALRTLRRLLEAAGISGPLSCAKARV